MFKNRWFIPFIFHLLDCTGISYPSNDQKPPSNFCPLVWERLASMTEKHRKMFPRRLEMTGWLSSLKCGMCFGFKSYLCIYPAWSKSKTVHLRGQREIPILKPVGDGRVNGTQWFHCWHGEQPAAFLQGDQLKCLAVWFSFAPQKMQLFNGGRKPKTSGVLFGGV